MVKKGMNKFKLPFKLVLFFSFFCFSFTDVRARIVDTIEALKEKKIGTEAANIEIIEFASYLVDTVQSFTTKCFQRLKRNLLIQEKFHLYIKIFL